MSKAEQTRQLIIKKAALIFNIKGYHGTSISDILETTGLTKGSIYGNFSNKNELALAAFDYNSARVLERLDKRMKSATSSKEALLSYPNYYMQNWHSVLKTGGCPLINAAVEADDNLLFMRESVRERIRFLINIIKEAIVRGQAISEFNQSAKPSKYATLIFSLIEGSILIAKIMNDKFYLQIATEKIKQIVEQELEQ